jgi:hypothetical protein
MNLEQKRSKKYAWIATIIYLLLFPILIGLAGASFMVFDSSSMTIIGGLSLYLVWSRYTQGKYRQSRVFCLIPLVILIMTAIYDSLISAIHYWL